MAKDEEKQKAEERGKPLTAEEEALEDARDAFHADKSDANKEAFKAAQQAVVATRQAERVAREAAGPPVGATNVQRDLAGRAFGWNEGPNAAVAPGGVA